MGKNDGEIQVYCLTWPPKYERILPTWTKNISRLSGDSKTGFRFQIDAKLAELLMN